MKLDTEDLAAIKAIVNESFSNVPLSIVAGLSEARIQHVQLYASLSGFWTLRIERVGSAIHLEWYDVNNERMALTVLRGV